MWDKKPAFPLWLKCRSGDEDDDSRKFRAMGKGILKSLCRTEHGVQGKAERGGAVRHTARLPAGQGQDTAFQILSEIKGQNTGIFNAGGGSLPDETDPYFGSIPKCKDDCKGAAAK